jgi:hypothetical protein
MHGTYCIKKKEKRLFFSAEEQALTPLFKLFICDESSTVNWSFQPSSSMITCDEWTQRFIQSDHLKWTMLTRL